MIKPNTTILRLRTMGTSVGAVLLGMACGGDEGPAPPGEPSTTDVCEADPALPRCNDIVVVPPVGGAGGGEGEGGGESTAPPETPPEAEPSEADLQRAIAEGVLLKNCGQCHGSSLEAVDVRAGMNYIDDVEQLVENGKILPLRSAESPIVQRMRDGSMPPPGVTPRPSDQDIATVASYIDTPGNWPGVTPPEPARSCDGQLIEFDELFGQVQTDLIGQDADDRPFIRYITLTNRYNAGICSEYLDPDRWAMSKLVNMLSIKSSIRPPVAVDREQTIYRVDIRDYGWDREVVVNGQQFVDGWEAMVASSPYAIAFVGDEADQVSGDTGTAVPLIYSDALLDVAALGNLYYALIDVDVGQSLDDFIELNLGINVQANFDQERVVRAGTTQSDISNQDRVLERHDIEVRQGVYWQSFDFEADEDNESIFQDPFGFNEGGTEAIFTLPNGLLAFVIADADRNIVEESNILLDAFQNDYVARTSVSCANCHAQGFNFVRDEVGPFVKLNRLDFDADVYEAVQDVYPTPERFQTIVEEDSLDYQRSLAQADVPADERDPVSRIFVRFNLDLDLDTVAGDLGVSPQTLSRELNRLDPALRVLDGLTIDRDDFTALFEASICTMQTFAQNQPDPESCALALEALE